MDYKQHNYRRVNVTVTESDWCSYSGICKKSICIKNDLCSHCKYKIPVDIPEMIKKKMESIKEGG